MLIMADAMRLRQGLARLAQDVDHAGRRHRSVILDQTIQVRTVEQLHHIVERAVFGVAVIKNLDRVPVRETGGGADFALEEGQAAARLCGLNILIEFDDMDGARRFYESPEYTAAKAVREQAAEKVQQVRQKNVGDLIDLVVGTAKKYPTASLFTAGLFGYLLGRLFRR